MQAETPLGGARLRDGVLGLSAAAGGEGPRAGGLVAVGIDLHRRQFRAEGRRPALRGRSRRRRRLPRHQPPRRRRARRSGRRVGLRPRRGLLRQRHRAALVGALSHVRLCRRRTAAGAGGGRSSPECRTQFDHGPFHGRPRRARHRAEKSRQVPLGLRFRADLRAHAMSLGREGLGQISRAEPGAMARLRRLRIDRRGRRTSAATGRPGRGRRFPQGAAETGVA